MHIAITTVGVSSKGDLQSTIMVGLDVLDTAEEEEVRRVTSRVFDAHRLVVAEWNARHAEG